MELDFSKEGNITGGVIVDYLLEKNRVVSQNPEERNFHIFYSLCAGISAEEKSKYLLYEPEKYHYLNQVNICFIPYPIVAHGSVIESA